MNNVNHKAVIKPLVSEEIIDFAKQCELKEIILFGSRARGEFNRTSDIDLAVRGGDICRFR